MLLPLEATWWGKNRDAREIEGKIVSRGGGDLAFQFSACACRVAPDSSCLCSHPPARIGKQGSCRGPCEALKHGGPRELA